MTDSRNTTMNKILISGMLSLFVCVMTAPVIAQNIPDKNERPSHLDNLRGFTDTPKLPGGQWHVHDPNRPQPDVVTPNYNGEPVSPPEEATVLFDGTGLDHWKNKKWKLKNNYMVVTDGWQPTKKKFGDVYLHLEWRIPGSVRHWRQARGNSGVFLMKRYEIQVLDCWANRTYPDGMAGAIYGQKPPRVNACRKPGQWQSYDIFFKAPDIKNGQVTEPAKMSVLHNGIPIHNNVELLGETRYKQLGRYDNPPAKAPLLLQDKGWPVQYRNIWVVPME